MKCTNDGPELGPDSPLYVDEPLCCRPFSTSVPNRERKLPRLLRS